MIQEIFDSIEKPFIFKSTLTASEFDDWINGFRSSKCARFVALLRGERMKNIKSLFQEIAAALQFPYYFGENWNALNDCINDLRWLNATIFLIGITNSECILSEAEPENSLAFGELLLDTCNAWSKPYDEDQAWGRPGRPFHIVMQCKDEGELSKFGNIF